MLRDGASYFVDPFNYADNLSLAGCQGKGCFCSKSTAATCRTYAYLNTVYCFCATEAATKLAYENNDQNKGKDIDKLIAAEKNSGKYKNY